MTRDEKVDAMVEDGYVTSDDADDWCDEQVDGHYRNYLREDDE